MASESCPICGEEVDEHEDDPHGHFSTDDESDDPGGDEVHLLILGLRKDKLACGEDPETNNGTTHEPSVTCATCRATL